MQVPQIGSAGSFNVGMQSSNGSLASGTVNGSQPDAIASADEQTVRLSQLMDRHWGAAYRSANDAMSTLNDHLDKIDQSIAASRPDIGKWDFTLKDGRISVVGDNLKAADKDHIEKQINGDKDLVGAAKAIADAAVLRYETSEDNPSASVFNLYTGKMENQTYYKVADQLNGEINPRPPHKNQALHGVRYRAQLPLELKAHGFGCNGCT